MKSGSRRQGRAAVVGFESGPLLVMIRVRSALGQALKCRGDPRGQTPASSMMTQSAEDDLSSHPMLRQYQPCYK